MVDPAQFALFLAAALLLAVTPGPGLFYVAARGLAGGRGEGGGGCRPGRGGGGWGGGGPPRLGARRAFREGVLVEALNPKTAAFFLAFIPQFVSPGAGDVALQFVLLGTLSVGLNTLVDIL